MCIGHTHTHLHLRRLAPFETERSALLQRESFTQLEDALLALNMERSQVRRDVMTCPVVMPCCSTCDDLICMFHPLPFSNTIHCLFLTPLQ